MTNKNEDSGMIDEDFISEPQSSPQTQGDEYSYDLKIPKDRVAVLIGKDGETKKQLEEASKTKLNVDSAEGDVKILGKDALLLFQTREIIRAIGRGFNPDIALLLLKQDFIFELINLHDFVKGKNHLLRVKGRIIGSEGKSRKTIEGLTDAYISVYGKTVGIIGDMEAVQEARKAIEALLTGSTHSSVYASLERYKREIKGRATMLIETKNSKD